MLFENPLFLIPIITAPFLILVGLIMLKWPPKEANSLYGYRTPRSIKNKKNWDFSQSYSAKKLVLGGAVYLCSAGLGFFIEVNKGLSLGLSMGLLIVICFWLFVNVENALKQFENEKS